MEVGELNKILVFKTNTPTATGAGLTNSYTTLLTTRGSLKKNNGSRGLSFSELTETNNYTIVTRYQQALHNAMRLDMKIEADGRLFTPTTWEKIGEKRFYLRINVNEQRN